MTVNKFKVLFFGSDQFSVRILKHILDQKICPVQVVTKTHTTLDKFSVERQLSRHVWSEGLDNVNSSAFNIGLVASFGHMIDEKTVQKFAHGLFNVHPSLLPEYRGSTPVQAAILDGKKETGCTIMKIPPIRKFDVGDIVIQKKLSIQAGEYAVDLRDRLADLGAGMVQSLLTDYQLYLSKMRPQSETGKSLARKLKPESGLLAFKSDNLDLIDRKVRAYTGFISLYTICLGGLLVRLDGMVKPKKVESYDIDRLVKNLNSCDTSSLVDVPLGYMYFHKIRRMLCIKTNDGWSAFRWATPERKPKMSADDFYNGYLSKVPINDRLTDT